MADCPTESRNIDSRILEELVRFQHGDRQARVRGLTIADLPDPKSTTGWIAGSLEIGLIKLSTATPAASLEKTNSLATCCRVVPCVNWPTQ